MGKFSGASPFFLMVVILHYWFVSNHQRKQSIYRFEETCNKIAEFLKSKDILAKNEMGRINLWVNRVNTIIRYNPRKYEDELVELLNSFSP